MRAAAHYSSSARGELYYKKKHREEVGGSLLTHSVLLQSATWPVCVCLTIRNMQHQPSLCVTEVDRVTERHRLPTALQPI